MCSTSCWRSKPRSHSGRHIYVDVIAGLTRNPWWRTQSALHCDGCRVKPGMTTLMDSPVIQKREFALTSAV
jgi:hypothetical protein